MVIRASNPADNIQIGDYVSRAGIYSQPGVVTEKKENGQIVVDTSQASIDKFHRYTITTGLTPEEKEKFNSIMDQVVKMSTVDAQINDLQKRIDETKAEPGNAKITVKLHNEQADLIRKSKQLPKVYEAEADKLRM